MFERFGDFISAALHGAIGFDEFVEWVKSLYYSIYENENISFIWAAIKNAFIKGSAVLSWLLLFLCLSVAFFGQRIMGVLKFIFFFLLGFVFGAHVIASFIPASVVFPPWLVGLIIGIVAAVLYRFTYIIFYGSICFYCTYILCYHNLYIGVFEGHSISKTFIAIIVAVLVTILAFSNIRAVEMVGTSILGGWLASVAIVRTMYDFTKWSIFGGKWWVAVFVVSAIFATVGFIFQFKNRKKEHLINLHIKEKREA